MDAPHIDDLVAQVLFVRTVGSAHGRRWRRPRVAAALLALAGCAAMAATGPAGLPDAMTPAPTSAPTAGAPDAPLLDASALMPLSAIPGYARPHIRPLLRDEERLAALQAGKRLRAMDAATVAAVERSLLPVVITFPNASDPVSATTPVNTPASSPVKTAVAADPPVVYALATPITRTRIASELRQQLIGSSATVGELPGTPRAELMQVGEGWRAVVWPFATESDADKARHLLAERGIRTEVLKF